MAERIYTRDEQGKLEPLEEAPFASEDDLQALLAEHPELLDGEQMRPGDPRRWILIKREKGIAETSDAGDRWALDHLLIDQDATPTLVEVKRGANSEVRRKVVGQMLEYAAHATGGAGSWAVDDIRRDFEDNANAQDRNPDDLIADLLQTDGEPDVEAFWKDVGANLAARRIRLLFVADDIPDSLTRIVSFLNEQTRDNIEVLAVEIKQFSAAIHADASATRHRADRGRPSEERAAHQANARVVLGRVRQRRSTGTLRSGSSTRLRSPAPPSPGVQPASVSECAVRFGISPSPSPGSTPRREYLGRERRASRSAGEGPAMGIRQSWRRRFSGGLISSLPMTSPRTSRTRASSGGASLNTSTCSQRALRGPLRPEVAGSRRGRLAQRAEEDFLGGEAASV